MSDNPTPVLDFLDASVANDVVPNCPSPMSVYAVREPERVCAAGCRLVAHSLVTSPLDRAAEETNRWNPVPITELVADGPLPWVWEGYLARGLVTLLSAAPKAGKTTLVSHIARSMGAGATLGGLITQGRVLVVSEEPKRVWIERRDAIGLDEHVDILNRPFKGKPTQEEWEQFADHIGRLVFERDYSLVCIDTLGKFSPCMEENDSAQMQIALEPLRTISDAGAAVLVCHHLRKSDGKEGNAARGSTALTGFCDINLEFRRQNDGNRKDRKRVLTAFSRLDSTPDEAVLELDDSGYAYLGDRADANQAERFETILEILTARGDWMKIQDIQAAWPPGVPRPGENTLRSDLKDGASIRLWDSRKADTEPGKPLYYRAFQDSSLATPLSMGGVTRVPEP